MPDLVKRRAYAKAYRERHPEKVKAAVRKWHLDNPDMAKAWRLANRDKRNRNQRKYRLARREARLWSSAKERSRKAGVPFDIQIADIVIPERCPILGIPLVISERTFSDTSPSLDRIDPSLGYVRGNIQVISHKANTMKNNGTLADCILLGEWARRTVEKK